MSPFELIAAAFGITSVFLSTRQNVWSWPTSLVNVTMYTVIFLQQRLYGLMAIQVFFAAVSIYGWYKWLFGGVAKTELKVSRTGSRLGAALLTIGCSAGSCSTWCSAPPMIPRRSSTRSSSR